MNSINTDCTKNELAYKKIKQAIMNGTFKQGDFLIERKLCELFEISRTPIREALRRLENERVLEFIQNKGTFVSFITAEDIKQIYDIREVVDPLAMRLCMSNGQSGEAALKMERHLAEQKRAIAEKDYSSLIKSDMLFHKEYIKMSRNPRLIDFIIQLEDQIRLISRTSENDYELAEHSLKAHSDILAAMSKKDTDLSMALLRAHFNDVREYYISKML